MCSLYPSLLVFGGTNNCKRYLLVSFVKITCEKWERTRRAKTSEWWNEFDLPPSQSHVWVRVILWGGKVPTMINDHRFSSINCTNNNIISSNKTAKTSVIYPNGNHPVGRPVLIRRYQYHRSIYVSISEIDMSNDPGYQSQTLTSEIFLRDRSWEQYGDQSLWDTSRCETVIFIVVSR